MLIKGKVEQKEQGKVSLVASSVEKFDPSDAEIEKAKEKMAKVAATAPKALKRRVDAAQLPATVIEDLRDLFERYPGETEFVLEMHTRTGLRRLKFGAGFRVQARDAGLRAELDDILERCVRRGLGELTAAARGHTPTLSVERVAVVDAAAHVRELALVAVAEHHVGVQRGAARGSARSARSPAVA